MRSFLSCSAIFLIADASFHPAVTFSNIRITLFTAEFPVGLSGSEQYAYGGAGGVDDEFVSVFPLPVDCGLVVLAVVFVLVVLPDEGRGGGAAE